MGAFGSSILVIVTHPLGTDAHAATSTVDLSGPNSEHFTELRPPPIIVPAPRFSKPEAILEAISLPVAAALAAAVAAVATILDVTEQFGIKLLARAVVPVESPPVKPPIPAPVKIHLCLIAAPVAPPAIPPPIPPSIFDIVEQEDNPPAKLPAPAPTAPVAAPPNAPFNIQPCVNAAFNVPINAPFAAPEPAALTAEFNEQAGGGDPSGTAAPKPGAYCSPAAGGFVSKAVFEISPVCGSIYCGVSPLNTQPNAFVGVLLP